MRKVLTSIVLALVFAGVATTVSAQGLHARIMARKAEAEKPKAASDAVEMKVSRSYQASYEDVLTWVKKSGDYKVDFANSNKDNGIVASTIEQVDAKGPFGWKKTGKRLMVELVKESDTETTLKVAVVYLSRIGGDNWSNKPEDIKLSVEETQAVVEKMKNDFYSANADAKRQQQ